VGFAEPIKGYGENEYLLQEGIDMSNQKKYIEGVNSKDVAKLASIFADDAKFDDTAAVPVGAAPLFVEGKKNIERMFADVFAQSSPKAELIEEKYNMMFYDLTSGDLHIPCIGIMEEKDGLIQVYTIRPRA
jgi:hypothetical protein